MKSRTHWVKEFNVGKELKGEVGNSPSDVMTSAGVNVTTEVVVNVDVPTSEVETSEKLFSVVVRPKISTSSTELDVGFAGIRAGGPGDPFLGVWRCRRYVVGSTDD